MMHAAKQQELGIYHRYTRPDIVCFTVSGFVRTSPEVSKYPFVQTKFGRRAFSIAHPTVWNALSNNIRRTDNVTTFKRVLKVICSNWLMTVDVHFHL